MKKIILLLSILLIGMSGFCQVDQDKSEKYIIGIIEEKPGQYLRTIDFLENSTYVRVYMYCVETQVIGVEVINNEFRNYDEFYKYLKFEYSDLRVYKKDETLFTKECLEEFKKDKK